MDATNLLQVAREFVETEATYAEGLGSTVAFLRLHLLPRHEPAYRCLAAPYEALAAIHSAVHGAMRAVMQEEDALAAWALVVAAIEGRIVHWFLPYANAIAVNFDVDSMTDTTVPPTPGRKALQSLPGSVRTALLQRTQHDEGLRYRVVLPLGRLPRYVLLIVDAVRRLKRMDHDGVTGARALLGRTRAALMMLELVLRHIDDACISEPVRMSTRVLVAPRVACTLRWRRRTGLGTRRTAGAKATFCHGCVHLEADPVRARKPGKVLMEVPLWRPDTCVRWTQAECDGSAGEPDALLPSPATCGGPDKGPPNVSWARCAGVWLWWPGGKRWIHVTADASHADFVSSLRACFPRALAPLFQGQWTRANHAQWPRCMRRALFTFLCVQARLRLLPERALTLLVVGLAACDGVAVLQWLLAMEPEQRQAWWDHQGQVMYLLAEHRAAMLSLS